MLIRERASSADSVSPRPKFRSVPVDLPPSLFQNFFEEAKISPQDEAYVKKIFDKFAQQDDNGILALSFDDFSSLLETYKICPPDECEAFFYAMDRNHDDKLDFSEFFRGCCAADPAAVHILNSFTGFERARYIFDFFDINRSGLLNFNEFARLNAKSLSLQSCDPDDKNVKRQAVEKAKELGALEDAGHLLHFTCMKFKTFYEHVHAGKLRGTSRLFRFRRGFIQKKRQRDRDAGQLCTLLHRVQKGQ